MRIRSRPALVGAVAAAVLLAGFAASVGPVVRARIAREAARRHLVVSVGTVRPGWFAVVLRDVTVRSEDGHTLQASIPQLRVEVSAALAVRGIELTSPNVEVTGSVDEVRAALGRKETDVTDASTTEGRSASARGLSLRWHLGADEAVELEDALLERSATSTHIGAARASLGRGKLRVRVRGLALDLSPERRLERASAREAEIEWESPKIDGDPSPAPTVPTRTFDFDLGRLRSRIRPLGDVLAHLLANEASVTVDELTWKLQPDPDHPALTVGPGPLVVRSLPDAIEARYSADTRGDATSMTFRLVLPRNQGDVAVTLEGGPLPLSQLGMKEGAAGLVDVEHATVAGRASLRLAGDETSLTFDLDGKARGLSIQQPRLARETVRGLDLELRARGAIDPQGGLRVDDFGATLGVIHVVGSGSLTEQPDHVAAWAQLELPSTPCQSLLESVPTALLPALQGIRWAGTLGARGHLGFDTQSLDRLDLSYDVQDQCRPLEVPEALSRSRFKQPFQHRIYLPDGSIATQTTGPGTANWTPLDRISPYLQVAVLTTEDGAFPHHHGFNHDAIRASLVANLKAGHFVRGASTISMQLAKNLFLERDKTLARKLQEVVLTDYIEQVFTKDELMELYLNVVEFGPAVYGVTAAAEYYFGRTPAELDLAESLFLSSLLPSPIRYGSMRDGAAQAPESWMRGLRNLMRIARKRGLLSDVELEEGLSEPVVFWHGGPRPPLRPPVRTRPLGGSSDDEPGSPDPPLDSP